MKLSLLSLALLLGYTSAKGQEYEPVPEPLQKQGLTLTLKATPTFLLDRFAPTIPVTAELGFLECLSLSAGYGIPFNQVDVNWSGVHPKTLQQNLRLDAQLRFYFRQKENTSLFTGIEAFYKIQDYRRDNMIYTDAHYTAWEARDTRVNKTASGISILFGTRQYMTRRFVMDIYAGLGRKVVDNTVRYASRKQLGKDSNPFSKEEKTEGTCSMFYIPFGISFGYQFGR